MDSISTFEASESDHLKRAQAAIEEVLAVKGKRTVENTLAPFDRAYDELQEAEEFANLVQNVHPDKAFRDNATAMVTKVSSRQSAMSLNPGLYQALRSMDVSAADEATKYYVKRQLLEFRLAGVDKDEATRARLNGLQDRLSKAQSQFERNIADGNRTVEVHDASELEGLPEDFIASHKPDAAGVIHLTTRYPDSAPVMTYAKSDALRKRMQEANGTKAYPENDAVLHEMMATRFEIARLVGYPTWSELNAQDKMMGSGRAIAAFITELDKTVRPAETREVAMELAEEKKSDPGATRIQQHQQQYLMEQVRRSRYNFDSASVVEHLLALPLPTAGRCHCVSPSRAKGRCRCCRSARVRPARQPRRRRRTPGGSRGQPWWQGRSCRAGQGRRTCRSRARTHPGKRRDGR